MTTASTPLISAKDLADDNATALRIDTVHKAKGESLDAVMYVTTKEHVKEMLGGVTTELGRIGYVAATRARDLLWIAVPHNALKELRPALIAKGFVEVGAAEAPAAKAAAHVVIAPVLAIHPVVPTALPVASPNSTQTP